METARKTAAPHVGSSASRGGESLKTTHTRTQVRDSTAAALVSLRLVSLECREPYLLCSVHRVPLSRFQPGGDYTVVSLKTTRIPSSATVSLRGEERRGLSLGFVCFERGVNRSSSARLPPTFQLCGDDLAGGHGSPEEGAPPHDAGVRGRRRRLGGSGSLRN